MQPAYTEQKQDKICPTYSGTGDEEDKLGVA
jgi:hypothetical protein